MNEKQKENALLWIKQDVKMRVIIPCFVSMLFFLCLSTIAVVYWTLHGRREVNVFEDVITFFLLVGIIVICSLKIRYEYKKLKAIESDSALITEVVVLSKRLKQVTSRSRYYCVSVQGLFENGKPVEKDIIISKRLYNVVIPYDKGYAVRFDSDDINKLPKDLGYFPK